MRALILALLLLVPAGAHAAPHGRTRAVHVMEAWSRPTMGAAGMGVVYLRVVNDGPADRLVGASTPVAAEATLHRSAMAGGVMRMTEEGPLLAPAKSELRLQPGGMHLMLMGVKRPLRIGQSFPVRLRFEHAGVVEALVQVRGSAPR